MLMRKIVSTIAVVALFGAVPALAALSGADKTFATEAAQGGLAEVQMGQMAIPLFEHALAQSPNNALVLSFRVAARYIKNGTVKFPRKGCEQLLTQLLGFRGGETR